MMLRKEPAKKGPDIYRNDENDDEQLMEEIRLEYQVEKGADMGEVDQNI